MGRHSAVGGMPEIGELQADFLIGEGLKPEHYLLDIGCGTLRAGIHFIRYLDVGRYYGLEKEARFVPLISAEIARRGLQEKRPQFIHRGDFDLSMEDAGLRFDFMLAQSVFTHLPEDQVELCLKRVMPRLAANGSLYATFWESETLRIGGPHPHRAGERRFVRYPLQVFERMARRRHIGVEYVGDWGHPRGQRMLRFYRL